MTVAVREARIYIDALLSRTTKAGVHLGDFQVSL
jgi:hypothetical protein